MRTMLAAALGLILLAPSSALAQRYSAPDGKVRGVKARESRRTP
jgi:hypothetical protein